MKKLARKFIRKLPSNIAELNLCVRMLPGSVPGLTYSFRKRGETEFERPEQFACPRSPWRNWGFYLNRYNKAVDVANEVYVHFAARGIKVRVTEDHFFDK